MQRVRNDERICSIFHSTLSLKIIHRPIQIQGKSRVDTWLRQDPIRQRQINRLVQLLTIICF